MKSRNRVVWVITVAALVLCSTAVFGSRLVLSEGLWPDSWPEELERYRDRARTIEGGFPISSVYEIPFETREDFERVWPHILGLRSKGAPLILVSSPAPYVDLTLKAGVRILSPGMRVTLGPDEIKPGPPWPDSARLPSGELPEYVTWRDGTWVPGDEARGGVRARQDIMLVCDGKVIDLNRIPLPADTPIIDRRFEAKSNLADSLFPRHGILEFTDMTPLEFLTHLESHGTSNCHFGRPPRGWIKEEHLPRLFELLDSEKKCGLPVSPVASPHVQMHKGSTVGREAALMIRNFKGRSETDKDELGDWKRVYPAHLGPSRSADTDKEELRKWWRQYQEIPGEERLTTLSSRRGRGISHSRPPSHPK